MRSLQRFSASVSRYRPPGTSGHALQAHRLGAASRSQVALSCQGWSRLVSASSSSLATFKKCHRGAPPARIFTRNLSLLSGAQNFLPLREADKMAPCGAGNRFDGEARAKKRREKCAGTEPTRLVALIPKIKAR